jgi:hypothetical protein
MVLLPLITGCGPGGIDEIRRDLGPFQYLGLDPELSFSVPTAEFTPAENEYASPKLRYTVNIKQNNQKFPLKRYLVFATANIVDSQGNKRGDILLNGAVENGVVSLSDVQTVYGLKVRDQADLSSLKLQVASYTWSPENKHKPYRADAETNNQ